MAIEFFWNAQRLLSIPEKDFIRLSKSQITLHKKTGVEVNPYGRTFLYPEHAQLWCDSLYSLLPELVSDPRARQACHSIIQLLEKAVSGKITLTVEGE